MARMNWTKVAKARSIERYGFVITPVGERPSKKRKRRRKAPRWKGSAAANSAKSTALQGGGRTSQAARLPMARRKPQPPRPSKAAPKQQLSSPLPYRTIKKQRQVEVLSVSGERRTFVATITVPADRSACTPRLNTR